MAVMYRILALLTFAALLMPIAAGQDSPSRKEGSELFNDCGPMGLVVEELSDDAIDIGLTEKALRAVTESRLRAARLYTKDLPRENGAMVFVKVHVAGGAFDLSIRYNNVDTDPLGTRSRSATWSTTDTHHGNAQRIVLSMSQHLDEFLAEYLQVNELACGSATVR